MSAKANVRETKTSVPQRDVLFLALWAEKTVKANDVSKAAVIPLLGVAVIERRATRRLVVPVKNWGWAVTLPVTKKTGVAIFVPRSRQALRLVRFLHVSVSQKDNLMLPKRWATYARS